MPSTNTPSPTLHPHDITEENKRPISLFLLKQQAAWCADTIVSESTRWAANDIISDDGSDYMRTSLDLTNALTTIAYEGTAGDLIYLLFDADTGDEPRRIDITVHDAASDGICEELAAYADLIWND